MFIVQAKYEFFKRWIEASKVFTGAYNLNTISRYITMEIVSNIKRQHYFVYEII